MRGGRTFYLAGCGRIRWPDVTGIMGRGKNKGDLLSGRLMFDIKWGGDSSGDDDP